MRVLGTLIVAILLAPALMIIGLSGLPASPQLPGAGRTDPEEWDEEEIWPYRLEWYREMKGITGPEDEDGAAAARRAARAVRDGMRRTRITERDPGPTASRAWFEGRAGWSPVPPPHGRQLTGDLGQWLVVQGAGEIPEGVIRFPLSAEDAQRHRLDEARIFRFDPDTGRFALVELSGIGRDSRYIWARVRQAGYYGVFAPPLTPGEEITPAALLGELGPAVTHPLITVNPNEFETWSNIGPNNFAGRTKCLVAHPHVGGRVYAGAAEGGLWLTEDAGLSWRPLTDDQPSLAIGALRIIADPDFGPDHIYAGLGEYTGSEGSVATYPGEGILRSMDGGESWEHFAWKDMPTRISTILVDPDHPGHIWVGGNKGLWRSTPGPTTLMWEKIISDPVSGGVLHPTDPGLIYIARHDKGFLIVTHDPTSTTPCVFDTLGMNDGIAPADRTHSAVIDVSPTDPDVIFGRIDHFVYRWDPDSGSWSRLESDVFHWDDTEQIWEKENTTGDLAKTQKGWDITLRISPHDPDIIYTGGVNLYWSHDGGATWWREDGGHSDYQAVTFDPQLRHGASALSSTPQKHVTVYVANDGGVFRKEYPAFYDDWYGGGKCGVEFSYTRPPIDYTGCSGGLVTAQFFCVTVSQGSAPGLKPPFVLGGSTQDWGVRFASGSIAAPDYALIKTKGNEGGPVAISPLNANLVMWSAWDNKDGVQWSEDGGASWQNLTAGLQQMVDENGDPKFQKSNGLPVMERAARIAMHPADPDRALISIASTKRLYLMEHGPTGLNGIVWQEVGSFSSTVRSLAWSPVDPDRAFLLLLDGRVRASVDGGLTWVQRDSSSYQMRPARIVPSWTDPDRLFLGLVYKPGQWHGTYDQIFESTDGGWTWAAIDGSVPGAELPNVGVTGIVPHPTYPGWIYISTDAGPFVTHDGGQSWEPFTEGLPNNVVVTDLTLHRPTLTLYLSTIGRGFYRRRATW